MFAFPFWKLCEIDNQWLTNIDQLKVNVNFALCENLFFWTHQKEKNSKPKCDWCTFYFVAPYVGSL